MGAYSPLTLSQEQYENIIKTVREGSDCFPLESGLQIS